MRTQASHGICGWGVILVGILIMFGPSAAAAEMPRAVYYDVTQVAQADTAPERVADNSRPSTPAPTVERPADPDVCLDPAPQRAVGIAALLSDLMRP